MDKAATRKQYKALRAELTDEEVRLKSSRIALNVQSLIDWPNITRMHVYRAYSPWNEVDTNWVKAYTAQQTRRIEIIQPSIHQEATVDDGMFDVIIVPLVAFDETCHRIGHGGGWYDRFLALHPSAVTIGLAYDIQRCDLIQTEPHDMPLDYIVTESKIFTKSAYRRSPR